MKFSLLDPDPDRIWAQGSIDFSHQGARYTWRAGPEAAVSDTIAGPGIGAAVARIVSDVRTLVESGPAAAIEGVVHRIVHGGSRFTEPVLITAEVRTTLADLVELAPLHNRPGLEVIDAAFEALPGVAHVAVFDTAFHATLAPEAFTYPLPFALSDRWKLRRYGFHGLSHAYCAARGRGDDQPAAGRPAPGDRSSRQRCVGDGDARRSIGRHLDGFHAARGADDGNPERFH